MVEGWVRLFNEAHTYVHDELSGCLFLVNDNMMYAAEEKLDNNRQIIMSHISRYIMSFVHEIVSEKLKNQKLCAC